jgi:RNA-directed DNA polymerase
VAVVPSGEMGMPQGGVISPLLRILTAFLREDVPDRQDPGTLVRYADDIVVFPRDGEQVLQKVAGVGSRLTLHPKKTAAADEGFDFLGVHFRLRPVRKQNPRIKFSCRIWPSDRSVLRIKARVKEVIGRKYGTPLEELIREMNPVLRGWNNYHTTVQPERKRLVKLNSFIRERFRIFLKRKYNDQSRGARRVHGNVLVRLGLFQLG